MTAAADDVADDDPELLDLRPIRRRAEDAAHADVEHWDDRRRVEVLDASQMDVVPLLREVSRLRKQLAERGDDRAGA